MLNKLVDDEVVNYERNKFKLDQPWIERLNQLNKKIETKYGENTFLLLDGKEKLEQDGDFQVLLFKNLISADNYERNMKEPLKRRETIYCLQIQHFKDPLVRVALSKEIHEISTRRKLINYMLLRGNTQIDKWAANLFKDPTFLVRLGVDCAEECETSVIGDYVFQLYINEDVIKFVEKVYSKAKSPADVNVLEFYKYVYEYPHPTKLIIMKNREIANQLKKQIMGQFK